MAKSRKAAPKPIILVDTNILLDFYRARSTDGALSLLGKLVSNRTHIITSSQIEMEFKSNRIRVILDSLLNLKKPEWGRVSIPAFLIESSPRAKLERAKRDVDKQIAKLQNRLKAVLDRPSRKDQVFRSVESLFRSSHDLNLTIVHKDQPVVLSPSEKAVYTRLSST